MRWIIRNIDLALINALIIVCDTILSGICFGWGFTMSVEKNKPYIALLGCFIGYAFIVISIKIFLKNKKTVQ